ncbi:phosphoribosylaminoimidazolesuccinocarboxamide synthase [Candidatus Enterovibrio escicola]|uniref:phosphoribosylaminoimidazolesuccinocarboxamide synthase n=1 Tax=Candidatus Enterovibrio escicola TaxID=1927127 RepID=UPI001237A05F|nr:phosphoribosylaminoimidazolesuccinocarboxamide synthase [Candidatus Enterovibrio escacola]
MNFSDQVLAVNDDLPIRTHQAVHSGKVRAVYYLTEEDSQRLIKEKRYNTAADAPLAIMIISDRISAFDCIWKGECGLKGVLGKGVVLNTISNHWFKLFRKKGLADSHVLDVPHPFIWIVQKTKPVKIEAVCRQYITGSLWRTYAQGKREFCGITLPEGLMQNKLLPNLLITPSTKGILNDIPDIPEINDINITRKNIEDNFLAFNFSSTNDIILYENYLRKGFNVISNALADIGQILVDTKFEFGYVTDIVGQEKLIYMDEVGTPDSSRIWDTAKYQAGEIIENSKEDFRQFLLNYFLDPDILLNKERMPEREILAQENELPVEVLMAISKTYINIAERIIGHTIHLSNNPRQEIITTLRDKYDLIDG